MELEIPPLLESSDTILGTTSQKKGWNVQVNFQPFKEVAIDLKAKAYPQRSREKTRYFMLWKEQAPSPSRIEKISRLKLAALFSRHPA